MNLTFGNKSTHTPFTLGNKNSQSYTTFGNKNNSSRKNNIISSNSNGDINKNDYSYKSMQQPQGIIKSNNINKIKSKLEK